MSHIISRVALEVRERRELHLTGVQSLASLLKAPLDESGYVRPTGVRQIPMIADRMVEPKDKGFIDMLQALPAEDAAYYAREEHVVETAGKSSVIFEEVEQHYGFIGGELSEFLAYLRREDVRHLWSWDLMTNIKAVAGVSTVLKKNGYDQRKLIMQCAANYMFGDPTTRAHLGMGGGSSLARVFVKEDHMCVAACDEDSAFTYVKGCQVGRLPLLCWLQMLGTFLEQTCNNRLNSLGSRMLPLSTSGWPWVGATQSTSS